MVFDPSKLPDLSKDFPRSIPDLKINPDLDNPRHGPHFDIISPVPGGIEKLRIDPSGKGIGGETQIGPVKMPWKP